MKKTLVFGFLALSLCSAGCTATRSGVQQLQEPRAVTVVDYTPSIVEVRKAIFAGVHAAKWRAQDRAPGLVFATNRWRGSQVTLAIDYTATTYTILYKDSTDDDYSAASGNIPQDFPRWASFIAKNIDEKIAVLGKESQAQIKAFPRIAPVLPGEPVSLEGQADVDSFKLKNTRDNSITTRFDAQDKAVIPVGDSQKQEVLSTNEIPSQSQDVEERDLAEPALLEQENTPTASAPLLERNQAKNEEKSVEPKQDAAPTQVVTKAKTSTTPLSSLEPLPTASSPSSDTAHAPQYIAPPSQLSVQSPPVIKAMPVNLLVPEHDMPKTPTNVREEKVEKQNTLPQQAPESSAKSSVNPIEEPSAKSPAKSSVSPPAQEPAVAPPLAPISAPQQEQPSSHIQSKVQDVPVVVRAMPVQLLVPKAQEAEGQNLHNKPVPSESTQPSSQQ